MPLWQACTRDSEPSLGLQLNQARALTASIAASHYFRMDTARNTTLYEVVPNSDFPKGLGWLLGSVVSERTVVIENHNPTDGLFGASQEGGRGWGRFSRGSAHG